MFDILGMIAVVWFIVALLLWYTMIYRYSYVPKVKRDGKRPNMWAGFWWTFEHEPMELLTVTLWPYFTIYSLYQAVRMKINKPKL